MIPFDKRLMDFVVLKIELVVIHTVCVRPQAPIQTALYLQLIHSRQFAICFVGADLIGMPCFTCMSKTSDSLPGQH